MVILIKQLIVLDVGLVAPSGDPLLIFFTVM